MSSFITYLETEGDDCLGWNHHTGAPGVVLFGNAVQVWSIAQGRDVTVQEAALAFNVEPKLIRQAVDDHPWMLINDCDVIDHDGD